MSLQKPKKQDQPPERPPLAVRRGSEIELSLLDFALPAVAGDHVSPEERSLMTCQCTVQVKRAEGGELVVSRADCPHANNCFKPGRKMYGLATDVGRTTFETTVLPFDESEADVGIDAGLVRLSTPRDTRSVQRHDAFRVPVFPTHRLFIDHWPLDELADARPAVRRCLDGEPWRSDEPLTESARVPAIVLDLSVKGIGLIVNDYAATDVGRFVLLRLNLPGLLAPLALPARVQRQAPQTEHTRLLGLEFLDDGQRPLRLRLEHDLGHWLTEFQRNNHPPNPPK